MFNLQASQIVNPQRWSTKMSSIGKIFGRQVEKQKHFEGIASKL